MSFQVGDTVGDYRLVALAGAGAVGRVFKVEHAVTGRVEAMKVLAENHVHTPEQEQRFRREVQVQARLNHPNIAAVHNAFWVESDLVMVMEFVEGESLNALLKRGVVSVRDGIDYCCQALDALTYSHSCGVTHRDIKPANMIVTPKDVVKLTDFGLAKTLADPSLTQSGAMVGSIAYMSPEQVRGHEPGASADIYSLGVVLYEVATGARPFEEENAFAMIWAHVEQEPLPPESHNPDLPPGLSQIILKALAKNPAQRFRTAADFRNALTSILQGLDRAEEKRRRSRGLAPKTMAAERVVTQSGTHEAPPLPQEPLGPPRGPAALLAIPPIGATVAYVRRRWRFLMLAPALAGAFAILIWTARPARKAFETVAARSPQRVESQAPDVDAGGSEFAEESGAEDSAGAAPAVGAAALEPSPQTDSGDAAAVTAADASPAADSGLIGPRALNSAEGTPAARTGNGGESGPEPWPAAAERKSTSGARDQQAAATLGGHPPPGWDPLTPTETAVEVPFGAPIHGIALSSDGRWIAVGTSSHAIRISDAKSGATVATLLGHTDRVVSLSFSEDRSLLASGSWDGTAKVWNIDEGRDIMTLGARGSVSAVALSADGKWMAAGATDKTVYLWKLRGGDGSRELKGHKRSIQALAFSPDSASLASAAPDERILVWPVGRDADPRQLPSPPHGATTLAFSPNGGLLASAGGGLVKIWNVASGLEQASAKTPGWLYSLAFDGGRWLSASAPSDTPDTIQVWQESRKVASLPHNGAVRLIAWSRNGETLATAGEDGRVFIWELKSRLVATAQSF